jgi:uncharacterized protein YecE (DUF72 family)
VELRIGCCGWSALRGEDVGETDWKTRFSHKLQLYAAHFPLVEVNSTFYRLPRLSTAERWRALADEVSPEFEFTVKVHQEVTHRSRFRGEAALQAFSESAAVARLLRAKVLLLQCPPSFSPTPENEAALREFLSAIDRDDFLLVWEPRGRWEGVPDKVAEICREYSLVHCTDPFKTLPALPGEVAYLRLHGAPPGERMYRYTYTDEDLRVLARRLGKLSARVVYVLFNNDTMVQDALRFQKVWEEVCRGD